MYAHRVQGQRRVGAAAAAQRQLRKRRSSCPYLLGDQAAHSLLGDGAEEGVVEVDLIPHNLHLALGHAEGQRHPGGPHVLIADQLDDDVGEEGVGALVGIRQRKVLLAEGTVRVGLDGPLGLAEEQAPVGVGHTSQRHGVV